MKQPVHQRPQDGHNEEIYDEGAPNGPTARKQAPAPIVGDPMPEGNGRGWDWLGFAPGTSEGAGRAAFLAKFGRPADRVLLGPGGLLLVGPIGRSPARGQR
jgi:hypothetical protein